MCEKQRVNEANLARVILLTREVSLEMSRDLTTGQLAALDLRLMGPGGDFNVEVPGAITNLGEPAIGTAERERAAAARAEHAAAAKREAERVAAELAEHAAAAKREADLCAALTPASKPWPCTPMHLAAFCGELFFASYF